MFVNGSFHVIHTAVAYFDAVFIEDSVKFMLLREVFVYELEEGSADVSLYVLTEWGIVPDDVALSVSCCTWRCFFVAVVQCFGITAGFEGVFVDRLCFVVFSFVA